MPGRNGYIYIVKRKRQAVAAAGTKRTWDACNQSRTICRSWWTSRCTPVCDRCWRIRLARPVATRHCPLPSRPSSKIVLAPGHCWNPPTRTNPRLKNIIFFIKKKTHFLKWIHFSSPFLSVAASLAQFRPEFWAPPAAFHSARTMRACRSKLPEKFVLLLYSLLLHKLNEAGDREHKWLKT